MLPKKRAFWRYVLAVLAGFLIMTQPQLAARWAEAALDGAQNAANSLVTFASNLSD